MNTQKSNAMNHVINDQKYYICKICGYRMRKKKSDVREHLKKTHEIGPEDVVENYASVPNKLQIKGFHMKEWLTTQFTQIENQDTWLCTLCSTELIGSEPWMGEYNHLKQKHCEILIPVANDRSMPGSSSSTADIIASELSRNESHTAEMSNDISVSSDIEYEEMNENVYKFEPRMSVGGIEEAFIKNEDTIDSGNRNHEESRNRSEKLEVDVKREIMDDGCSRKPLAFVRGNGTSDEHRSGRSNAQGYHNSSTNDEQKIKCENSEHDESDDDIVIVESGTNDFERTTDIGTSANPTRASSKRLSVTSTTHRTPAKKAKPNSSGLEILTDPVDGNSSREADQPLPDSNTTSSSVSPETQLLSITDQIIRSMSTDQKTRVLQAVVNQLRKKRE